PSAEKADATHLFEGQVVPLLGRGAIKPVIDVVVPLAEAERGYELMEKDRTFGKVVLDLS
ncbi:MAG TPA: zinc-binding dehydrogenase, partial [Acidimicrobiia bacterium]